MQFRSARIDLYYWLTLIENNYCWIMLTVRLYVLFQAHLG
jgi:hypothetical protein